MRFLLAAGDPRMGPDRQAEPQPPAHRRQVGGGGGLQDPARQAAQGLAAAAVAGGVGSVLPGKADLDDAPCTGLDGAWLPEQARPMRHTCTRIVPVTRTRHFASRDSSLVVTFGSMRHVRPHLPHKKDRPEMTCIRVTSLEARGRARARSAPRPGTRPALGAGPSPPARR